MSREGGTGGAVFIKTQVPNKIPLMITCLKQELLA